MKNGARKLIEYIKSNPIETAALWASLLIMAMANTFFFPYFITAVLNGTGAKWFQYMIGAVLVSVSVVGAVWSLFRQARQLDRSAETPWRFALRLVVFIAIAILIGVVFSWVIGIIGTSLFYIFKGNIIKAKVAIDIASRILNFPLTAYMLCVFGNVMLGNRPYIRPVRRAYPKELIVALLYIAVNTLMVIPSLGNSTALLILFGIINSILYTLVLITTVVINSKDNPTKEKADNDPIGSIEAADDVRPEPIEPAEDVKAIEAGDFDDEDMVSYIDMEEPMSADTDAQYYVPDNTDDIYHETDDFDNI